MAAESLTISARFNGPKRSGNGGFSAGLAARLVGDPAEVSLRNPVPLDTELEVRREGDDALQAFDGDTLILEARAVPGFELEVPEPVAAEDARQARRRYRGLRGEEFSSCFVCGLDRDDSFGVFAGRVEGRDLVASTWTPQQSTADEQGHVRPEFIWAVLDCPTYFALYAEHEQLPVSFLARLTGRIEAPVRAAEEHVVIAWPIGFDGRKHQAGVAVLSAEGEVLAAARALLIQAR